MRFLELRLEKFGHFAGRTIDLSAGSRGLHVIHGANEAGKSTALRAILALLYGFPKQTPDDFRFAYKDLRVGARVEADDGRSLDLVRLKRDKDSLLGGDGRPVGERVMTALLAGIDKAVFERVFGLDQKRLREGGEELGRGGGVLAESLFAAGLGLAEIRRLRDALEAEADALFAPRATTRRIHELADKAKDLRAEADAAALLATDHEARERRLAEARANAERIGGEIGALDAAIARIERRMRARPKFEELDATERELAELADVPDLPESFAKELAEATAARRTWTEALRRAEDAIAATRRQKEGVRVAKRVLDRADAIRELYAQVDAYRRARADLPGVEAERRAGADEADAILRDLDPALTNDTAAALRLPVAERKRLEDLVAAHQAGVARLESADAQVRSARALIEVARAEHDALPASRDTARLVRILESEAVRGDLEQAATDAATDAESARDERDRALAAMPMWTAGPESIEPAAVPVRETVARFIARDDALEAERRAIDADLARLAGDAGRRDAERRELAREREVPTESALASARLRRDQGWKLVRGAWLRGESDPGPWVAFDSEREPADAFEHAVSEADDAADRLRRDAARVARSKALDDEAARDASRRAIVERRAREWKELRDAFEAEWTDLWRPLGIEPRSPVEMREWGDSFAGLREKARAAREADDAAERTRAQVADARRALREALRKLGEKPAAGEDADALVEHAKRIVADENRAERARDLLDETIRQKEREIAELNARLEAERARMERWAEDWRAAVSRLPLPPGAEPTAASLVLRRLDDYFGKEREIRIHEKRIANMRALIDEVRRVAAELCVATGIDAAGADAAELAERLGRMLDQARSDEQTLNMLAEQERRETDAQDEARRGLARAEDEIESLRVRARRDNADELEGVAERARHKRARIARRDELRLDLARETAGGDLDALRADVTGSTATTDQIESQRAADERARVRVELDETNREIGEAGADLRDTVYASKTGALLEQRERVLTELADHVANYRRLRLAAHLLRARIESLRERAQNPTMARAGEIFETLTRGSFAQVVADYGADSPRLLGVRADAERVETNAMSDGTRDQLWLALRLAWIELRAVDGLALPVIADDLLVQFDEVRATAALEALALLSDRTQVLLFTHHRHTSDLVRALDEESRSRVFEHELGG